MSEPAAAVVRPEPGFMVVHGNRPEVLRDLLVHWVRQHPLAPLDTETVLVQSQGMAQWLKLSLAREPSDGGLGVAAAFDMSLPARFLWRMYRCVLGPESVPESSPFDKAPLAWRILRLLPGCLDDPRFIALRRFLSHDVDGSQPYRLALRLADLFDQYQVYRADWLADWAEGRDVLRRWPQGERPLPADQCWQALLWRAVLGDAGDAALSGSRAGVHQRLLDTLAQTPADWHCPDLPPRIIVFGISALPAQFVEVLGALSRHCQVLLCVHNPCQHYWGDIVADRDLLRHAYRRQRHRPGQPSLLEPDAAASGHPLLASWGKQGRDYLHMLDQYDEPASYRNRFLPVSDGRVDVFVAGEGDTLLAQLQDDILDLRPLAESRSRWPAVDTSRDQSIRFHVTHSPQREVEVLHDQLLARLEADPTLQPRDIVVMVPDVAEYAPHVAAVFGQPAAGYEGLALPYTLADRPQRDSEPMLLALALLLRLPEQRCTASEILGLFDVEAVRAHVGVDEVVVSRWRHWVAEAGVRWGLDGARRELGGLPAAQGVNTWRFGLHRMVLGYAAGDDVCWSGVQSYADVAGLEAADLGPLALVLQRLSAWADVLATPASPVEWGQRLTALLADFFAPQSTTEQWLAQRLQQRLEQWLQACALADFDAAVTLAVAREAWLAGIDEGALEQRFLSGGVNVCTLMPMRAVPFRVVCLLGMNDGAYPRPHVRPDFDLMAADYRPGDRSRREDDRYLLLEALLSARDQLYVSWVGRSVRDHAELPPSVLVGQLRDHLAAGWRLRGVTDDAQAGAALLDALTQEHPLQPFSRRYFEGASARGVDGFYTYARQWRAAWDAPTADANPQALLHPLGGDGQAVVSAVHLSRFLRQPVDAFFGQRLGVSFREDAQAEQDDEVFQLDGLVHWQAYAQLCDWLAPLLASGWQPADSDEPLQAAMARLSREGRLPLGAFGQAAAAQWIPALREHLARYAAWRAQCAPDDERGQWFSWSHPDRPALVLEASLDGVAQCHGEPLQVRLVSQRLHDGRQARLGAVLPHWVDHLCAQCAWGPHRTVLVGQTGDVAMLPMAPEQAEEVLGAVLLAWDEGMRRPLPVAREAALAWLRAAEQPELRRRTMAETAYEGDGFRPGEVARSPALARAYGDFDALWDGGAFAAWADTLYAMLLTHVASAGQPDGGHDAAA